MAANGEPVIGRDEKVCLRNCIQVSKQLMMLLMVLSNVLAHSSVEAMQELKKVLWHGTDIGIIY